MNNYSFGEVMVMLFPLWHALFITPLPWLNKVTALMLIIDVAMVCGYAKVQYSVKKKPQILEFMKHFHVIRSYVAANVFSALLPYCSTDLMSAWNCVLLCAAVGCCYLWLLFPWAWAQSIHESIKGKHTGQ